MMPTVSAKSVESLNSDGTPQMIDVLGLGYTAVDDLIYVDAYPLADAKTRVRARERQCGGLTATALATAARLGCRCAYAGTLGEDEYSRFVIEQFRKFDIELSLLRRRSDAHPVRSNIIVDSSLQTRTILYDLNGVVGRGTGLAFRREDSRRSRIVRGHLRDSRNDSRRANCSKCGNSRGGRFRECGPRALSGTVRTAGSSYLVVEFCIAKNGDRGSGGGGRGFMEFPTERRRYYLRTRRMLVRHRRQTGRSHTSDSLGRRCRRYDRMR